MNFITRGIKGGVKLTQWKIDGKECLLCSKEKKNPSSEYDPQVGNSVSSDIIKIR